jgi:hypothetical protein
MEQGQIKEDGPAIAVLESYLGRPVQAKPPELAPAPETV